MLKILRCPRLRKAGLNQPPNARGDTHRPRCHPKDFAGAGSRPRRVDCGRGSRSANRSRTCACSASATTIGNAPSIVSNCVATPRFANIARISLAFRSMSGWSLAMFGIARSSASSTRISRSCCARHARVCLATIAGSAKQSAAVPRRMIATRTRLLMSWLAAIRDTSIPKASDQRSDIGSLRSHVRW